MLSLIKLYEFGKKDQEFLDDLLSSNQNVPPEDSDPKDIKHLFGASYYGYILAKFGDKWRDALSENSKK